MNPKTEDLSDDFVADLLAKEAKENSIRYSPLGLQAFPPKRSTTNAPRPNLRFLRNIVREADNHNAALLVKEAGESKERLRQLQLKERAKRRGEELGTNGEKAGASGEKESRNGESESSRPKNAHRPDRELYKVGGRRLSSAAAPVVGSRNVEETSRADPPVIIRGRGADKLRERLSAENPVTRGRDTGEKPKERSSTTHFVARERDSDERPRDRRRRTRSRSRDSKDRSRSPGRERKRHRRRSRSEERRRSSSRSRKHREHRSGRYHRESDRQRDRERERERERERDRAKDKSSDKNDHNPETKSRHRSSVRSKRHADSDTDEDKSSRKKKRTEDTTSVSPRISPDLLDEIIGPAPPPPAPRPRGRGTTSGASTMDARFSEKYDPSLDVRPDSDIEEDWDGAVEAFRDRQKWKALHAEKLRLEGHPEDFITAWRKGDTKNTENIKWAKDGVREWDRGKVVEEETGEISLRASWAKGGRGKDK